MDFQPLAMIRRDGPASVFLTVAPSDAAAAEACPAAARPHLPTCRKATNPRPGCRFQMPPPPADEADTVTKKPRHTREEEMEALEAWNAEAIKVRDTAIFGDDSDDYGDEDGAPILAPAMINYLNTGSVHGSEADSQPPEDAVEYVLRCLESKDAITSRRASRWYRVEHHSRGMTHVHDLVHGAPAVMNENVAPAFYFWFYLVKYWPRTATNTTISPDSSID